MGVVRFVKLAAVGVDVGVFGMLKKGRIPWSGCGKTKAVAFFPCLEVGRWIFPV